MGCGNSKILNEETVYKRLKNDEIEEMIEINKQDDGDKFKLLLLGAGESGKRQMRLIYGDQYTLEEREGYISGIVANIFNGLDCMFHHIEAYGLISQIQAREEYELIKSLDSREMTINVGSAIRRLWADPVMQIVWNRRNEYQLIESVKYYLDNIDHIKMPDYIPSKDDIIHIRIRTSGIISEKYTIDGLVFELYDVGGQRNERKKWIHCFEGVTAVIFVAALSEYDQVLFEDHSQNRMVEAIRLFDEVCSNQFFKKSSVILFLNKRDLFEQKIKVKSIRDSKEFSDYKGPDCDYEAGIEYFIELFHRNNCDREIYHHVTCATDTKNVRVVFDACKTTILRNSLKDSGFVD